MSYEGFGHDKLMIRKKLFAFLGQQFHIYDPAGALVFYTKQKAFKLKEDIRVFTDESMTRQVLGIKARGVFDFGMTYDVYDVLANQKVGALRRKGLKSILRDEWHILDVNDQQIGTILEDSMMLAMVRRFLSNLVPQTFHGDIQGKHVMVFKQRFNPFVAKIDIDFSGDTEGWLDRRLGIAAAVMLCAVEGRQSG
jgi:uncharacterized protein YxjI